MQDRGTPPAGLVRQAPDHRVTTNALAPAASTPPVLTSNTARQHCMVCLNALTRHLQPQAIQARERAQIRAIKGSAGHVEVFQVDGVGISIIGRPRPLPGHDTPNPANNTYTLNYEEPSNAEPGTSWPTSTTPTPATAPPKPSTAASNTYAAPPSDSETSPTTSPEHSSKQEDSDPNYTLNYEEPVEVVSFRVVACWFSACCVVMPLGVSWGHPAWPPSWWRSCLSNPSPEPWPPIPHVNPLI